MPNNPTVTDFASVGDIPSLGTTALTELAQSFEQLPGDVGQFFPDRTIEEAVIVIERTKDGVGIAPLVNMGQPDAITDSGLVERKIVQPAHSRESDFVPQGVVNQLRQVGTANERAGKELLAQRVQRMVNRSVHLWKVLQCQTLLGGVNYTDPRTGAGINVSSFIPAGNLRDLATAGAGRTWDNLTTALPIHDLRAFKQHIYMVAKTKPTHILMRSSLKLLLEMNKDIIDRVEGSGARNAAGFVEYRDGELFKIAGMEVVVVDTLYDDPVTGNKGVHVWPINKVVVIAKQHQEQANELVGETVHCIGEDPMGRPGRWMRSSVDQAVPAPPGAGMQLGDSALPYLRYPDWVGILTVGNATTLANKVSQNI